VDSRTYFSSNSDGLHTTGACVVVDSELVDDGGHAIGGASSSLMDFDLFFYAVCLYICPLGQKQNAILLLSLSLSVLFLNKKKNEIALGRM